MKAVYPVIISPKESDGLHLVTIPDIYEHAVGTQGRDIPDAMYMARDLIGIVGTNLQDRGIPLPAASALEAIEHAPGDIVTLIDVDLDEYRRSIDEKSVRRNVTIPGWLDYEANKAKVNVSAITQVALKAVLGIEGNEPPEKLRYKELIKMLEESNFTVRKNTGTKSEFRVNP